MILESSQNVQVQNSGVEVLQLADIAGRSSVSEMYDLDGLSYMIFWSKLNKLPDTCEVGPPRSATRIVC